MSIEQKINYQLNKYPTCKKTIKRIYQGMMYAISPKIKSDGNIIRISPNDCSNEYFFGYYDKSPWDITDRYMLCMRAKNTWSEVAPKAKADILLIDTKRDKNDSGRVIKISETHTWNVQQGCMLQWLGPDYRNRIIFNDFRNGQYCSVILELDFEKEIKVKDERVINAPVYSVAEDGTFALTLDFSRLHRLRPGYGYSNLPEETKNERLPEGPCIWKIDILNNRITPILSYTDFYEFEHREEMKNAEHKVNHIMISPNGKRFMVLHRWLKGEKKYSRLVTCNIDGTDMYNLSDDDMVSHCYWKNSNQIFAFENKKQYGNGYYLMKDQTQDFIRFWPGIDYDGHPSFSPDGEKIVFDRYPDKCRMASIMISDSKNRRSSEVQTVAKVFAPFKYDNDTRCDLHPRWNRNGNKICFDSVFEGHRGLYILNMSKSRDLQNRKNIDEKKIEAPKYSIITPMYNSFHLMKKYFNTLENQTFQNFEVLIIDDCSTDDSFERLYEYAKKSSLKIRIYRTSKNGGPGIARNIGIDAARGEWITFVDNDDWIDKALLEKVDNVIIHNDVNCVIYDYIITNGKNEKIGRSMYEGAEGYVPLSKCISSVRNHSIGKFYKLENCKKKNIRYPELRRCEDVAFVCRAIDACGTAYYLKEPLYYYYQRPTSLSNNIQLDEQDLIKAFSILDTSLGNKYPHEIEEKSVADLLYGVLLIMCKSGKSNEEIKRYIRKYEKKYPNWWKTKMFKNIGIAKKIFLITARYEQIFLMKRIAYIHSKLIG